jgi:hypothetical protein
VKIIFHATAWTVWDSSPDKGWYYYSSPDRIWSPTNGYRGSFPGLKPPVRDVDHSPAPSIEVKIESSDTSTPCVYLLGVRKNTIFLSFILVVFYKEYKNPEAPRRVISSIDTQHDVGQVSDVLYVRLSGL